MVDFLWRIPKHVKFEICRDPVMRMLKLDDPRLHNLLRHIQSDIRR